MYNYLEVAAKQDERSYEAFVSLRQHGHLEGGTREYHPLPSLHTHWLACDWLERVRHRLAAHLKTQINNSGCVMAGKQQNT